ncbi:MAG: T9SS type A sorting domain-containing protein [Flavobacteriales bacterium]|nr:T9SS type A sorting domain-containing protein [Flavobacteriales bacterium]
MKQLTLLIGALMVCLSINAQLQNGDFENWTTSSDFDQPDVGLNAWLDSNYETFFSGGVVSVSEIEGVSGSALRVESTEIEGETLGGFAIWGAPPSGEELIFENGFPFTDNTVTQLSVDMRYSTNILSPGIIIVQFKFEGAPAGAGNLGAGTYYFPITGEQLTWETMTFDIDPEIGTDIDECVIAFASNNLVDDMAPLFAGDFLEIDNVEFVGAMQEIPGGDLDNWIPALSGVTPDDWEVAVSPLVSFSEQTTDASEGDFAVKINTVENDGEANASFIYQGDVLDDQITPSIPTGDNFYGISFDYKYNVLQDDTAAMFVVMSEVENPEPQDMIFELVLLEPQANYGTYIADYSDWLEFIDLNYVTIVFTSSYTDDDGFNVPQAGSELFVDNVQFLNGDGEGCGFDESIVQGESLILCPGVIELISVPDTYDSYQWYRQPTFGGEVELLDGETTYMLQVDAFNFAVYDVWCEVTLDGCTEASSSIAIDGWAFVPTVVASNETEICEGESTTLTAQGAQGTVVWYQDGVEIMGTSGNTLEVTESGTYVAEIYPDLCPETALSSGVGPTITVNPAPDPEIFQGLAGISCVDGEGNFDAFESYEWYVDGMLLEGEEFEEGTISPPQDGNYTVVVTNDFGCEAESDPLFSNSVEEQFLISIELYPSPATDILNVVIDRQTNYQILDAQGRLIAHGQLMFGTTAIDVSPLAQGNYFMKVEQTVARFAVK